MGEADRGLETDDFTVEHGVLSTIEQGYYVWSPFKGDDDILQVEDRGRHGSFTKADVPMTAVAVLWQAARTGEEEVRVMEISLDGWDIGQADRLDWVPWGSGGDARAKVLGSADGFVVALVEAEPGYRGDPHEHAHPEFFFLIDGTVHNQGQDLVKGDGYAAAPGSVHTDFGTDTGATYLSIFKL
jgi:quercetin dioxygenase-like cupin family protein